MQRGKDPIWNPRLSLAAWGTLGTSLSLEPWSLLYSKGGSLYHTGTVGYSILELSSFVKAEAHSENLCVIWVLWEGAKR